MKKEDKLLYYEIKKWCGYEKNIDIYSLIIILSFVAVICVFTFICFMSAFRLLEYIITHIQL